MKGRGLVRVFSIVAISVLCAQLNISLEMGTGIAPAIDVTGPVGGIDLIGQIHILTHPHLQLRRIESHRTAEWVGNIWEGRPDRTLTGLVRKYCQPCGEDWKADGARLDYQSTILDFEALRRDVKSLLGLFRLSLPFYVTAKYKIISACYIIINDCMSEQLTGKPACGSLNLTFVLFYIHIHCN